MVEGDEREPKESETPGCSPLRFADQTGALNCPLHNGVFRIIAFSVSRPIQRDSWPILCHCLSLLVMGATVDPAAPVTPPEMPSHLEKEPGRATRDLYAAI